MASMMRSLRHRNFRLFFFGQGVSLLGTWIQTMAMQWFVYVLTGNAWLLGVIGFTGQIPIFLLAPLAGVLADRWNRHRIVLILQILLTFQALAVAVLVMTGTVQFWHLVVLSLAGGTMRGFEIPTRQTFIIDMLDDRRDLPNALAMNSFLVNGARFAGPILAGLTIALGDVINRYLPLHISYPGESVCFLANGLSFLPVIWALVAMRLKPQESLAPRTHILGGLVEGFRYAYRFAPIRAILLLVCLGSLVAMPYTMLMPVFAKDILHGNADTQGYLMGAVGAGAVLGAIILAMKKSIVGFGRLIAGAGIAFGAGLVAFGLSHQMTLSVVVLVVTGLGMMVQMVASNTVLQTIADEDKRGRVVSLFTMAFIGMSPFGSLLVGGLAEKLGAPLTVVLGGVATIIGAVAFAIWLPNLDRLVRPIYIKMGILPDPSLEKAVAEELLGQPKDEP